MISYPIEAAPSFPAGVWSVQRKIIDHVAGQRIVFEGIATITGDTFAEQGEALVNGRTLPAVRRYRLRRGQTATDVFFPEGRPFATFGELPSQRIEHHCGNDRYTGRFFFVRPDFWVEFWRVRGPRKRYSSLTRFERMPDGALFLTASPSFDVSATSGWRFTESESSRPQTCLTSAPAGHFVAGGRRR